MRVAPLLVPALLLTAAAPAAADHEALLGTAFGAAVHVAGPFLRDLGDTTSAGLRWGQDMAYAAVPDRCGLVVLNTAQAALGLNCGSWGNSQLSYTMVAPGRYDAEFHISGYARYWINEGTMRVSLEGSCPGSEMEQWGPATGLVPTVIQVDCYQTVTLAPGECRTLGGRASFAWTGAHAPPPRELDMSTEVCG